MIPGAKCCPASPMVKQLLDRPGDWMLCEDLLVIDGHIQFVVPAGFVSDYASPPRIARPLIQTTDTSTAPPFGHDWLYRNRGRITSIHQEPLHYNRERADVLFKELMEFTRVKRWRRWAAYHAVRRFGGGAWGRAEAEILDVEEVATCSP